MTVFSASLPPDNWSTTSTLSLVFVAMISSS
jgi:hypothetical protein